MVNGEMKVPDTQVGDSGVNNWLMRVDARVARLEERSVHTEASDQRMMIALDRLGERMTIELSKMRSDIDVDIRQLTEQMRSDSQRLHTEFAQMTSGLRQEFTAEAQRIRGLVNNLYRAVLAGLISMLGGIILWAVTVVYQTIRP